MEGQDFWNDNDNAQKIISECNQLRAWTVPYQQLKTRFENAKALLPDAYELNDQGLISELTRELVEVEKTISSLEVRKMLSGEMDNKSCYLTINSGAGGTESCDWVQMLSRMYQRWAVKLHL